MVSEFNTNNEDVSFSNKGFILGEGLSNEAGISGYPWLLQLPASNPDPTVVIVDGGGRFEFTDVDTLNRDANSTETELDNEFFAQERTGFDKVTETIQGTEYEYQLYTNQALAESLTITVGGIDYTFDGVTKIGEDVYAEVQQ